MLDIKYWQKLNTDQLQFYHGNGIPELKIEVKTINRKWITFFRLLRCFRLKTITREYTRDFMQEEGHHDTHNTNH